MLTFFGSSWTQVSTGSAFQLGETCYSYFMHLYNLMLFHTISLVQILRRSLWSFNIPPPGNPRAFDCRLCRKGGFWVGILNLSCWGEEFELAVSSLSRRKHVFYLKYAGSRAKEEGLKRKSLQGLGFKAWSVSKKLKSLILPFTEKLIVEFDSWVGHLNTVYSHLFPTRAKCKNSGCFRIILETNKIFKTLRIF